MRGFPWSFLRPSALVVGRIGIVCLLVASCCVLLGEATGDGDDGQSAAAAVHDWDIRSLYRVRFQHITKRPPSAVHPRMVDRRSKLATRWAALKDRIAEFFPSRHTNPRTVITFDRLATDFVNVGIVKLAKVLDPPKPPKRGRKGKADTGTVEPPSGTGVEGETVALPETSTKATPDDARPKRRVTLVMDLPDFLGVQEDSAEEEVQYEEEDPKDFVIVKQSKRTRGLPSTPEKLVCEEAACAASVAMGDHRGPPRTLITVTFALSLLLCTGALLRM